MNAHRALLRCIRPVKFLLASRFNVAGVLLRCSNSWVRPRAFGDLSNLAEVDFLREISEGLSYIAKNVAVIDADFQALVAQNRGRGARILRAFASEEAGKYLILLDAVRCPKNPRDRLAAQLKKANSHLAKGLYAESTAIRPVDLAEVKRWVDRESQQFYLDGPNGIEWVFRNRLTASRENSLYVDYVHAENAYYWDVPELLDENISQLPPSRAAPKMVRALADAGFGSPGALAAIAGIWRPVSLSDKFDIHELRKLNIKTLEELSRLQLLAEQADELYSFIAAEWFFPLYALPMREIPVPAAKLEAERNSWSP